MTTTYTVPTLFYEDHISRDLGEGCVALITSPDKVIVSLTNQAKANLLSDAMYYGTGWLDDELSGNTGWAPELTASANATVEALT